MADETAAPTAQAPPAQTRPEDTQGLTGDRLIRLLERLGQSTVALLARPRLRTALAGIVLILIGALWVTGSVWTFPIVIVGILMVIVAWVGSRLEGRFAVEWSEAGAGFELRARFRTADSPPAGPSLRPPDPSAFVGLTNAVNSTATRQTLISEATTVGDDETIEGEAHTVEIDVDEFAAIVRVAEQLRRDSATSDTPATWHRDQAP